MIVSGQALIDSRFSTLICAPVYSSGERLATQVTIGPEEELKHASWIVSHNLVSLHKADLLHYVGSIHSAKQAELDKGPKGWRSMSESKAEVQQYC